VVRRYLLNFDTRELQEKQTDCLIVGGGVAGLFTAWHAAQAGARVMLLTKQDIEASNSQQAQGGIAAALGPDDSPDIHMQDTLLAGAGLCDAEAVTILVHEGREAVRQLIGMGAQFDQDDSGISLTREGCHSKRRVLHAHGDATGAELVRVLYEQVAALPNVTILEKHYAVDLLVADNICYGLLAIAAQDGKLKCFKAAAVVLATGGVGQLYSHTTNPDVATADGIALAYRAGAEVMDMEFMQFHPTALVMDDVPSFLISEAVRGEGAILRNEHNERFMPAYHAMEELAPRDVVARAIYAEMLKTGAKRVWLDLSEMTPEKIKKRFPTITATCAKYGLDITSSLIPVAPAAHYMMGGVKINLQGETSIKRLFCCGEASCSGVHGANRLASNSLLDGLVFGRRIAKAISGIKAAQDGSPNFTCSRPVTPDWDCAELRSRLKRVMAAKVGLIRTADGLAQAAAFFAEQAGLTNYAATSLAQLEVLNMLEAGSLISTAAAIRTESRGGHFRQDYPRTIETWQQHILLKR